MNKRGAGVSLIAIAAFLLSIIFLGNAIYTLRTNYSGDGIGLGLLLFILAVVIGLVGVSYLRRADEEPPRRE